MSKLSLALSSLLLAAGATLAPLSGAQAEERPRVVAVNYALSYFAERLGAGDVDVAFPVPEGTDPSFWRPGISDISKIQSADLILLNGAGFSTWTTKASLPRSRIVDTSRAFSDRFIETQTVTHSHGADGEHSHTGTASYTWLNQELALMQADAVAAALTSRGLVEPEDVQARLAALSDALLTLDRAAEALGALAEDHVVIATHPRYQYFAEAYGLDIRALEWEAGVAPNPEQLAHLQTIIEETGATILLWEMEPPQNGRDAVRSLGLSEMVFPTLARRVGPQDYVEQLSQSIEELTALLEAVGQ